MCLGVVCQCLIGPYGVTRYVLASFVFVLFAVRKEQISVVILEGRVLPFPLGFEKKSKRVSPGTVSSYSSLSVARDMYPI